MLTNNFYKTNYYQCYNTKVITWTRILNNEFTNKTTINADPNNQPIKLKTTHCWPAHVHPAMITFTHCSFTDWSKVKCFQYMYRYLLTSLRRIGCADGS